MFLLNATSRTVLNLLLEKYLLKLETDDIQKWFCLIYYV